MKKPIILCICLLSTFYANSLWAWPPGLRSSSSFFRGNSEEPRIEVASFGDSVASGFNSDFWLSLVKGGTYADHFGKWLNKETDRDVKIRNLAWAGFTLEEILGALRKNHIDRIQKADLIFLEGGGNDFLDLYGEKFIDLCKAENFYPTLEKAKSNFLSLINDTAKHKKTSAKVRVLGIYYPLVHETRTRKCQLKSVAPTVHAAFLNAMTKFNWFLAKESRKRGFVFVDNFAHLNCKQQNWNSCKMPSTISENTYTEKVFELDRKKLLQDPGDLGWLQKDRVHPNTNGHNLISWVIRNAR